MKKLLLIMLFALVSATGCQQQIEEKEDNSVIFQGTEARYELFPTDNIWTFLKLDTRSGKIWQVQYSVKDDNRGEIILNNKILAPLESKENGRFTLYPTKNLYNFILLDQKNGKMWQVQWSPEDENRGIIPM